MSNQHRDILDYLTPVYPSFWTWSPDCDAIVWCDKVRGMRAIELVEATEEEEDDEDDLVNSKQVAVPEPDEPAETMQSVGHPFGSRTLCMVQELELIVKTLTRRDSSPPPLSAILLLITASHRVGWDYPAARSIFGGLVAAYHAEGYRFPHELLDAVMDGLKLVHQIREELDEDPEARAELYDLALSDPYDANDHLDLSDFSKVIESLTPSQIPVIESIDDSYRQLVDDLTYLAQGMQRLSSQALQARKLTGLDDVPDPDEAIANSAQLARELVADLQMDEEFYGIGRMARKMMAAVTVPRHLGTTDGLPVGGLSDISNRGTVDKLLVSELANDEMTLSMRIAMNEALYLRRETPPAQPPVQRSILVDVGVRSWGVPRLLSVSAALALLATASDSEALQLYTSAFDEIRPAMLHDRADLIDMLSRLEPDRHPGFAMNRFFEAGYSNQPHEIFIITPAQTLEDDEFQQVWNTIDHPAVLIITVDRSGQLQLLSSTSAGVTVVSSAQLDPNDLVHHRGSGASRVIDARVDPALPAILRYMDLPLRVPVETSNEDSWHVYGGPMLTVASDRRLLLWDHKETGPVQVCVDLPSSKLLCASAKGGSETYAIIGRMEQEELYAVRMNLDTFKAETVRLKSGAKSKIIEVFMVNSMPVAICEEHLRLFDSTTGRCIYQVDRDEKMVHHNNRFFVDKKQVWHMMTYDGERFCYEPIWKDIPADDVIQCFDVAGVEGPVMLTRDGEMIYSDGKSVEYPYVDDLTLVGISRSGQRALLKPSVGRYSMAMQVDVNRRKDVGWKEYTSDDVDAFLEPRIAGQKHPSRFYPSITAINVGSKGAMMIQVPNKGWMLLMLDAKNDRIAFARYKGDRPPRGLTSLATPSNGGYVLKQATWSDGSRIVVDSRGMLHFQPAGEDMMEFTLVINETRVSGWSADGRVWGDSFFIGDRKSCDVVDVYENLIRPFLRRLAACG